MKKPPPLVGKAWMSYKSSLFGLYDIHYSMNENLVAGDADFSMKISLD